jgi:VanZ family protein
MSETDPNLRYRALWLAAGWALVGAILWLSLTPRPPEPFRFHFADKVEHFAAYLAVMGWFALIYFRRAARRGFALGFLAMGVAIEFLQALEATRYFELADMLADALGIGAALLLARTPLQHTLQVLEGMLPGAESRTNIR